MRAGRGETGAAAGGDPWASPDPTTQNKRTPWLSVTLPSQGQLRPRALPGQRPRGSQRGRRRRQQRPPERRPSSSEVTALASVQSDPFREPFLTLTPLPAPL